MNGKKYVGITSTKPETRWGHDGTNYSKQILGRAIKKYGWDAFKHEILFAGLTEEEAVRKEIEMIDFYNCVSPYGYNADTGGGIGIANVCDEVRQKMRETTTNLWKDNSYRDKINEARNKVIKSDEFRKRQSEIAIEIMANPEIIEKRNNAIKKHWENLESRKKQSEIIKKKWKDPEYAKMMRERSYDDPGWRGERTGENSKTRRTVVLVNDACVYTTIRLAAKEWAVESSSITAACKLKLYYAGIDMNSKYPLVWRYKEDYDKMTEEEIIEAIHNANISYSKYSARKSREPIRIRCITTGEVFDSIKSAIKKYGLNRSGMWKCCNGKQTYYGRDFETGELLSWEYA